MSKGGNELICLRCVRPESLCTCKSQPSQMSGQHAVPEVSKMLEKWKTQYFIGVDIPPKAAVLGSYQDGINAMVVHLEECLAGRIEPTNPTMQRLLEWRDNSAAVASGVPLALAAILAAEDPDAAKELVKQGAQLMGKLGGASKSAAKQRASKKNGRKGGRPKKTVDKAGQ